jgi:hypothetical protein
VKCCIVVHRSQSNPQNTNVKVTLREISVEFSLRAPARTAPLTPETHFLTGNQDTSSGRLATLH